MYTLLDGVARNRAYPRTFLIPSELEKSLVVPGEYVQLGFTEGEQTERMWVMVTARVNDQFTGYLDNDPAFLVSIEWQDIVHFNSRHIIKIA